MPSPESILATARRCFNLVSGCFGAYFPIKSTSITCARLCPHSRKRTVVRGDQALSLAECEVGRSIAVSITRACSKSSRRANGCPKEARHDFSEPPGA